MIAKLPGQVLERQSPETDFVAGATDSTNAFRADIVTNQPDTEALLANAPDRDGTFFKVPKIIE